MAESKVVQVIRTKFLEGKGTEEDVLRCVVEYFTLEGERIARHDPCETPPENMINAIVEERMITDG